jgi:hypothetical protein
VTFKQLACSDVFDSMLGGCNLPSRHLLLTPAQQHCPPYVVGHESLLTATEF